MTMGIVQYQSSKTENNLSQVLRHIDVLHSGLTLPEIDRLFNSKNAIGSECVSCMINLLLDPKADFQLLSNIIELLCTMSKVFIVCDHLEQSFSLSSVICLYVVQHAEQQMYGHMILKFMSLMQKVTYGRKVSSSVAHNDQFLSFIFAELEKREVDITLSCLKVLNNLIINHLPVQVKAKAMFNQKRTKRFMQLLNQGVMKHSILSLSILTRVFWEEEMVKKLYRSENWFKITKLIFSILYSNTSEEAKPVAADLCVELMENEEIADQISMYNEENGCALRLFEVLNEASPLIASKIVEVILAFCRVRYMRSGICKQILSNKKHCWNTILNVISGTREDFTTPIEKSSVILTLDLINEICEEVVESCSEPSQKWLEGLFAVIRTYFTLPFQAEKVELKLSLTKILKGMQILHCLSTENELLKKIAESMDSSIFTSIIEHQLTHNLTGIVSMQPDWSEIGLDVVLVISELMLKMKHLVQNLEKNTYNLLQDNRMILFYAAALTSGNTSRVQCSLRLLQEALSLPDTPTVLLGEKILEINRQRLLNGGQNASTLYKSDPPMYTCIKKEFQSFDMPNTVWRDMQQESVLDTVSIASVSSTTSTFEEKENIDVLIEKLQGKVNGRKSSSNMSQVVELYEQKIGALTGKEAHLQDLLDAKALALSQADRVIAHNRCQRVQSEEQAQRLTNLLKESDRKCEHLLKEMEVTEANKREVEKELGIAMEETRKLAIIVEEHDSLLGRFNDKEHQVEVLERNNCVLKREYETLKEMYEMIQKHNENFKQQHGEAVHQLEQLEQERLKLLREASDREVKINDLEKIIVEHECIAKDLLDQKSTLEAANQEQQRKLLNSEEEIKSLKIKITSGERTKKQLEHHIKEGNSEIKRLHQKAEDQDKKMATLHNEREDQSKNLLAKDDMINKLQDKLNEQGKTMSAITQLLGTMQCSQNS